MAERLILGIESSCDDTAAALCSDKGAMMASAVPERVPGGQPDGLGLSARPRWPLDTAAAPLVGSGRKGAKG